MKFRLLVRPSVRVELRFSGRKSMLVRRPFASRWNRSGKAASTSSVRSGRAPIPSVDSVRWYPRLAARDHRVNGPSEAVTDRLSVRGGRRSGLPPRSGVISTASPVWKSNTTTGVSK
ncbi:hypothetical protein D3C72_957010 [compost metagenome]